ncbi:MAG: serine protease [Burkholderiales bacterium]
MGASASANSPVYRALWSTLFITWICYRVNDAWALEPNEIFKQTKPGVVVIHTYDAKQSKRAQASGILVAGAEVVTNCHVVRKASRIEVVQGAHMREARMHYQDLERNLCQISLDSPLPEAKPVTVFVPSTAVEPGQSVFAVGSPFGQEYTIVRGMVAGIKNKAGESAKLIQTDVAVPPGSSGGGLFDQEARLVGIMTAGLTDAQNLNIVLPSEWALELPRRNAEYAPSEMDSGALPKSDESEHKDAGPAQWRPMAGERWVYRATEKSRNLGLVTIEVLRVTGSKIRERITREGHNSFRAERDVEPVFDPTRFYPSVSLPGGYQFVELSPYLPPGTQIKVGQS